MFFLLWMPELVTGEFDELRQINKPSSLLSKSDDSWTWKEKISQIFKMTETTVEVDSQDFDQNDRELESSSSGEDDYWQWPDDLYMDDYGDFYDYEGDPKPPSLFPIDRRDVIGFMLSSLGITLGSTGGIGGGGIVVPIYIIAIGLPPRVAIPLGSVTVLGSALAGLILNLKRRHPLADRPIIDWDLILVMEPLVLVGAIFGAILHRVVSEKILVVLLVLLLSAVAHTTLAKAKRMYDAEEKYIEHLKAARWDYLGRTSSFRNAFRQSGWSAEAIPGAEDNRTLSPVRQSLSNTRTQSIGSFDSDTSIRPMGVHEKQRILILNPDFVTLRSDMLEQEKVTPRSKVMALLAKFSVLMFLNITMGGGAFKSPWGIECGGLAFWIVHVIMIAFLVASAWAAQTYLVNRHELKEIVRFDYVHGDIKWERRTALVYPGFFIASGLCAGMFGIGGGIISVPLMLTMGVHPAVVTATASTMVFFTSSLSASSFAVFNLILWDYAVVCFGVGFLASMLGQSVMQKARQTDTEGSNFERNSFIAYIIGGVILLSALLMTMQYVLRIVSYDDDSRIEEGGLCESIWVS